MYMPKLWPQLDGGDGPNPVCGVFFVSPNIPCTVPFGLTPDFDTGQGPILDQGDWAADFPMTGTLSRAKHARRADIAALAAAKEKMPYMASMTSKVHGRGAPELPQGTTN